MITGFVQLLVKFVIKIFQISSEPVVKISTRHIKCHFYMSVVDVIYSVLMTNFSGRHHTMLHTTAADFGTARRWLAVIGRRWLIACGTHKGRKQTQVDYQPECRNILNTYI